MLINVSIAALAADPALCEVTGRDRFVKKKFRPCSQVSVPNSAVNENTLDVTVGAALEGRIRKMEAKGAFAAHVGMPVGVDVGVAVATVGPGVGS